MTYSNNTSSEEIVTLFLGKKYSFVEKPFPHFAIEFKMSDVSHLLPNVNYKIFQSILSAGGAIKVINVKGKSTFGLQYCLSSEPLSFHFFTIKEYFFSDK